MLPLKNFPELDTKRLRLRGLTPSDKEDIFEMQADPRMCEHTDSRPETEISGTIAYIERMTGGIQEGKWLLWGLEEKATGKVIGTICLWNFSTSHKMAELGYGLLPSYQGKGLMKEALLSISDFAFQALHLKALDAYTEENNHPSIRLLKSCGFSEVDRVTDEGFYVDRDLNMVVFRLEK